MAGLVSRLLMPLLALTASFFMYYFSWLANYSPLVVSPEGCEMSWMSPHYILHTDFNKSWTPLASRYTLWLYRERGFDDMDHQRKGLPVLFIPGNAGSSRQVRSIASSAARQFLQEPPILAGASQVSKPLDFFTVEFNEDFSAIHPPTLLTQKEYTSRAIQYILSLYPKGTKLTLMGHSMGGIVAQLILAEMSDHDDNSLRAVFTMSTPSHIAPVRFDRRSETVYSQLKEVQLGDVQSTVPLISLCGGATDSQITSETCALPDRDKPLRRTIITTSLEGAWTGVGHREMVWCHQVRYLVARSTLTIANSPISSSDTLVDQILRPRPFDFVSSKALVNVSGYTLDYKRDTTTLAIDDWSLYSKSGLPHIHLLPLPTRRAVRFTLFTSKARINGYPLTQSHTSGEASLRVLYCSRPAPSSIEPSCVELSGQQSLLPKQAWPGSFPTEKGVNDKDYLSLFEAKLFVDKYSPDDHVALVVEKPSFGPNFNGWAVASIEIGDGPVSSTNVWDVISPSGAIFSLPEFSKSLRTSIKLPNLLSHALLVYRADATYGGNPNPSRLPPLLLHQSSFDERHYHSVTQPLYLHSHRIGPFVDSRDTTSTQSTGSHGGHGYGSNITIYSSGEAGIKSIRIKLAWRETLARLGVRYWMGLAMWSIAVVGIVQLLAWSKYDSEGIFYPPATLIQDFVAKRMIPVGGLLSLLTLTPLPKDMLLGNGNTSEAGSEIFGPIAFFMWLFACGLICASQYILSILTALVRRAQRLFGMQGSREERRTSKRWIFSILFICFLVATIIPYQVAFMIVFMIQFSICSSPIVHQYHTHHSHETHPMRQSHQPTKSEDDSDSHTSHSWASRPRRTSSSSNSPSPTPDTWRKQDIHDASNSHLLLLLTWLLPFTAPILVVWVRTLQTAGYTIPFDGDHNILIVLPWILLGEAAASGRVFKRESQKWKRIMTYVLFVGLSAIAVLYGPRYPYLVFEMATIVVAWIVITRVNWRLFSK